MCSHRLARLEGGRRRLLLFWLVGLRKKEHPEHSFLMFGLFKVDNPTLKNDIEVGPNK
jgi:hypothetical protein